MTSYFIKGRKREGVGILSRIEIKIINSKLAAIDKKAGNYRIHNLKTGEIYTRQTDNQKGRIK